jgi:hypothetical protein
MPVGPSLHPPLRTEPPSDPGWFILAVHCPLAASRGLPMSRALVSGAMWVQALSREGAWQETRFSSTISATSSQSGARPRLRLSPSPYPALYRAWIEERLASGAAGVAVDGALGRCRRCASTERVNRSGSAAWGWACPLWFCCLSIMLHVVLIRMRVVVDPRP